MKTPKEKLLFSFGGLKFEASNPGPKTIVILLLLLLFTGVTLILLKWYSVPIIMAAHGSNIGRVLRSKISRITKLFKGRSP
jgi:hypothetical protein